MKLARLLLMVALFGICWSVARADGTDPKVLTSGCGGVGEPACDPYFLTTSNPSEVAVTFTFNASGDASVDIVNWTGMDVGTFVLALASTDSLTYSCDTNLILGSFACSQPGGPGTNVFDFAALPGGTLCSVPLPDNPTDAATAYGWLNGTTPAPCQYGEVFTLEGDPSLAGVTVGATIFAPEPPSGLLLLIGLAAGAFVLRKRSLGLA